MVRRSLIVLILVVSAFQLLGVMRVPTVAVALPSIPLALTQTAEPPTPVPPTAVPPTAVPPTAVPPTAVPPTAVPPTPVPPGPGNTATPEPAQQTPIVSGGEATVVPTVDGAVGTPTPTPAPEGSPPPPPAALPKTGEGSTTSPLLWIGVAILAVVAGGMLRRRSS